MKVLIVDDSSVMRKVIERALRQTELPFEEILQAQNGSEALSVLREQAAAPPDIIFSDITMPGMTGLEFLAQRKAESLCLHVPVIMITSEGIQPLVMRAVELGARGYICKPFTPTQVRDQILSVVDVRP